MGREARNHAAQEGNLEEGGIPEHQGAEEIGPVSEAGGGDSTPYIRFEWDPNTQGLRGVSNIPNWEYLILKYAKVLKDQL